MRKLYESELDALQNQKNSISEQQKHYSNCIDDLTRITKALSELIDFSDEAIKKKFLDKFVLSIVPDQDTYYWNYRLTDTNEASTSFSVTGNKRNPVILVNETKEASDEDASDIHNNEIVSYFTANHQNTGKSTTSSTEQHRLLSQIRGNSFGKGNIKQTKVPTASAVGTFFALLFIHFVIKI
ncbi:MAG: hypothetical protein IKW87_06360 [Ruminococcus sp.]|nr:hypothetical protein [Ruminococcus sp.]